MQSQTQTNAKIQSNCTSEFNREMNDVIQRLSKENSTSATVAAARISAKIVSQYTEEATPDGTTLQEVDYRLSTDPQGKLDQYLVKVSSPQPFEVNDNSRQSSSMQYGNSNGNSQSLCRIKSPPKHLQGEVKSASGSSLLRTNSGLIFCNTNTQTPGIDVQNFKEFEKVNYQPQRSGDFNNLIKNFDSEVGKINLNHEKNCEVQMISCDQQLSSIYFAESALQSNNQEAVKDLQEVINNIPKIEGPQVSEFNLGTDKENQPPSLASSANQTPQFSFQEKKKFIPPAPKMDPTKMRGYKKPENNFLQLAWQPLNDVSNDSIFSIQSFEIQNLESNLKKHFSKNALMKPVLQTREPVKDKKIEGILDQQRLITTQMTIRRYNIDQKFLNFIDQGSINQLSIDSLQAFLSIYPKDNDKKILGNKLADFGYKSLEQGYEAALQQEIKLGEIEMLLLSILAYPSDLKKKAEVLDQISGFENLTYELANRIQCWKQIAHEVIQNKLLKAIAYVALQTGRFLNQTKDVAGFDLSGLINFFSMKSTLNREKSVYNILLKEVKNIYETQWQNFPSEIFDEHILQEIKNLLPYQDILKKVKEIQSLKESFEQFQSEMSPESPFYDFLASFQLYYNEEGIQKLSLLCRSLQESISKLAKYFGSPEDKVKAQLEVLIDVSIRHQKLVEQIKKTKAAKIKNQCARPKTGHVFVKSPKVTSNLSNFNPQPIQDYSLRPVTQGSKLVFSKQDSSDDKGKHGFVANQSPANHKTTKNLDYQQKLQKKLGSNKLSANERKNSVNSVVSFGSGHHSANSPSVVVKPVLNRNLGVKRLGSPICQIASSSPYAPTQALMQNGKISTKHSHKRSIQIEANRQLSSGSKRNVQHITPVTPNSSTTALGAHQAKKAEASKGSFIGKGSESKQPIRMQ